MPRLVPVALILVGVGFALGRMDRADLAERPPLPFPDRIERTDLQTGKRTEVFVVRAADRDNPEGQVLMRERPGDATAPELVSVKYPDGRVVVLVCVRSPSEEGRSRRD